MSGGHNPVLLEEVLDALSPRDGAQYVDGTFGGGGYTGALLERAECQVLGIDRDPDAIRRGATLARRYKGRLSLVRGRFSSMQQILAREGKTVVDGVVFDLGVSSPQLDEAERGFSFRNGPLDMRMEREGVSAADFLNHSEESEIARVIAALGEEREARRIARAIVAARPLSRAEELADIVKRVVERRGAPRRKIHPATRTFQAIRMHINNELDELANGLVAAERVLKPRGRLAVVSFHSLEDRVVKRFLAARSGRIPAGSRHAPEVSAQPAPTFKLLPTRTPALAELARNPRARSARLRAAERTSFPLAA